MAKRIQKQRLEEFQPPEKKLASEADLLIKELVKKQANTNINLSGQLAKEKVFEKSSSFQSITNFQSGQCSVTKLKEIITTTAEFDEWKSAGLCDEDVSLYNDYREGIDVLFGKHPKYEKSLLMKRIENIEQVLVGYRENRKKANERNPDKSKDHTIERPESNEAKLLKFALGDKKQRVVLPHPMDTLKDIKSDLEFKLNLPELTNANLNKIRRKARKLQHRLHANNHSHFESGLQDELQQTVMKLETSQNGNVKSVVNKQVENFRKDAVVLKSESQNDDRENKLPTGVMNLQSNQCNNGNVDVIERLEEAQKEMEFQKNQIDNSGSELLRSQSGQYENFCSKNDFHVLLEGKSKWDVKNVDLLTPEVNVERKKVYDCKPQNLYTVRDGEIIPIDRVREIECSGEKIPLEDIKKLPKFEDYSAGVLNNVLYVKNLNKVSVENLKYLCLKYGQIKKTNDVEFKVMSGRMKGQAFITFPDSTEASSILNEINGLIVNGKPLIVQYGKKT